MSVNAALCLIHIYASFTSMPHLHLCLIYIYASVMLGVFSGLSVSGLTVSVQVGALEVLLFFAAVGVSTDPSAEILAALPRALNASEQLLTKEFARPLVAHWALAAASAPGSDVTRWCMRCH